MRRTLRRSRSADDRGAALVEFAFVFPLLAMVLFGTITGGFALNEKQQITHATREGARFAATVPWDQPFPVTTPPTKWADTVQALVVERSAGTLKAADVCVSLVQGSPGTVFTATETNANWVAGYYSTTGQPCIAGQTFPVSADGKDTGLRVQVAVRRAVTVSWVLGTSDVVLTSSATARSEDGL